MGRACECVRVWPRAAQPTVIPISHHGHHQLTTDAGMCACALTRLAMMERSSQSASYASTCPRSDDRDELLTKIREKVAVEPAARVESRCGRACPWVQVWSCLSVGALIATRSIVHCDCCAAQACSCVLVYVSGACHVRVTGEGVVAALGALLSALVEHSGRWFAHHSAARWGGGCSGEKVTPTMQPHGQYPLCAQHTQPEWSPGHSPLPGPAVHASKNRCEQADLLS